MEQRNDLARPRSEFRTVEAGTLAQDYCPRCRGVLYRVPEGAWLHWATLAEGCKGSEAAQTPVGVPFGPRVEDRGPYPLDTPERGLARARVGGQYARPSWEWMGCVS